MMEHKRCPHCGKQLNPDDRITYTFKWWSTILMTVILSLMLFALDLVDDGQHVNFSNRIEWSNWAILGLWLVFISVQLIRYQPYYEWLMIPVSGILFSIFIAMIDRYIPPNEGFMQLDWAWYVIIPVLTFVVILPIAARIAREQPTHYDRLEYLVEYLAEEDA